MNHETNNFTDLDTNLVEGSEAADDWLPEEKPSKSKELREWVKDIGIAVVIAIVVMQFIKPTIVRESSMEPNFHDNDYLFISKQSYGLFGGDPKLGDVIVFESTLKDDKDHDKLLIKRIIGVPGDVIKITEGKVYVNGLVIDDSYTKDQYTNGEITDLVVPADSYFCLGDNRTVSIDSRSMEVGFIKKEQIVGKVVFRLLPFSGFGAVDNPYEK